MASLFTIPCLHIQKFHTNRTSILFSAGAPEYRRVSKYHWTLSQARTLEHFCNLNAHKWCHCYSLLSHQMPALLETASANQEISTGLLHSRFQIYLTAFTQGWNSHNLSSFLTVSIQPLLPDLHWIYLTVFEPSFFIW